jgi:hypothetical protein
MKARVGTLVLALLTGGALLVAAPDGGPSDGFMRMFHLPPFASPTPVVTAALTALGRRGGLMDARDDLAAGPIALIVDPALSVNNPNSEGHTAGVTFVGQFLDHDMTFDTGSRLGRPAPPEMSPNSRRPVFDLDSVYGAGPTGSPRLYDPADRAKFRVEINGAHEDLPREASGAAIISDPRNDENVVIAGLQVAFLQFHNHIVDRIRQQNPSLDSDDVFDTARQQLTWHYQWMILHEFLPQIVGPSVVNDILVNGRRFYEPRGGSARIPIEFQIAYRFGHSMVRPSYRANFTGNGGAPFFALVFDTASGSSGEPPDLRGGVRGSRRFIGWSTFFTFPGLEADVRPNKRIDTKLSTPLFDLPLGAIAAGAPPTSLAERNLLRHLTWKVPSGQSIAKAMGVPVLRDADLSDLGAVYKPFVRSTPLWFYVLRESDVMANGQRLGPMAGRLIAEVFIGLLQMDPASYLALQPEFVPTLGVAPGQFAMTDLLTAAGVAGKR